ncbi:hypothetical protein H310_06471 [Aphanomyces invadans]|uniref:Uncharacterized protein n=1 Tax=Aphanomyces invadans TaxID=157072 RepID=A0A024U7U0_9STRA|nr:hypothetical protein H310_06471 [Aphanomyces invadans]ETW01932.1 hypothetical protein H310_06471 [Aphanomyces invadans]|eukprot:XP_008869780.1 hypothetical protein H310_06471 [Aphanomyces invadans]
MMLHGEPPSPAIATADWPRYLDLSRPQSTPTRKRSRFSDVHEHSITEYYRQECLVAYYTPRNLAPLRMDHEDEDDALPPRKQRVGRRHVTFHSDLDVVGVADPDVDRRPTPVAPVPSDEMRNLLAARVIPPQNK